MRVINILVAFFVFTASPVGHAQQPQGPAPLIFQAWKDQQVLEAQNQVLRVSARISALKTTPRGDLGKKGTTNPAAHGRLKKISDTETVSAAEQDLKRAQESLAVANGLQFDDYVDIYIPTLSDQPEALQKLSEKLTKEELSQILKGLMAKTSAANDAKRNSAIAESLGVNNRSRTP